MDTIALKDINALLALQHHWCSSTELLDYISTMKLSVNSLVLYNDICSFDSSGKHYLSSGKHFLSNRDPSFLTVYLFRDLPLSVPISIENESLTIKSFFPETIIQAPTTDKTRTWITKNIPKDYIPFISAITGHLTDSNFNVTSLSIYLRSNNIPTSVISESIFEHFSLMETLFNYDLFQVMNQLITMEPHNEKIKNWYELSISRLQKIKRMNTSYYDIIYPSYKSIISKLLEVHLPTPNEMDILFQLFPSLDILNTADMSLLSKKIIECPSIEEQAYILGIPIHMVQLTPKFILQSLKNLQQMGEDAYIQSITNYNRHYLASAFPTYELEDTDLITGDSFYEYNLFDILPYVSNSKVHLYVRDEASSTKEKMKDRFNVPINPIFLETLIHRHLMAQSYKLGRAISISSLFDRLKNNLPKENPVMVNGSSSNNNNNTSSFVFSVGSDDTLSQLLNSFTANPPPGSTAQNDAQRILNLINTLFPA